MEKIIPWILRLLPLAEGLVATITQAIAEAKRNGELTEQQEAQFQARLQNLTSQEHWRTDAERGRV